MRLDSPAPIATMPAPKKIAGRAPWATLSGDPRAVAESYLGLGHAEPLRVAPPPTRDAVISRFAAAFEQRRGTTNRLVVVFARLGPP